MSDPLDPPAPSSRTDPLGAGAAQTAQQSASGAKASGALTTRVFIERKTLTSDGLGSYTTDWEPVTEAMCRLTKATVPKESVLGGRLIATETWLIAFRVGTDVRPQDRLNLLGGVFEVINTDVGLADAKVLTVTACRFNLNPLAVASAFTPATLPNLALWLSSADASSLFADAAGHAPATDGGRVALWKDKSGLTNHASAAAGQRPVYVADAFNGQPWLAFDGTNGLVTPLADNWTAFSLIVLFRAGATPVPYERLLDKGGFAGTWIGRNGTVADEWTGGVQRVDPPYGTVTDPFAGEGPGGPDLRAMALVRQIDNSAGNRGITVFRGLSGQFFDSFPPQTALDSSPLWIGSAADGAEGFGGQILEVIAYSQAISTQDTVDLTDYLQRTYQL